MAATRSSPSRLPLGIPRRRLRKAVFWTLVVLAVLLAWFWKPITGYMHTGTAVGARLACSCKYVAGRSLSDCRRDFEAGMGPVMLTSDDEEKRVTARYLVFAAQAARYQAGAGCVLDHWKD